jgi:thiol-disulfide isomerase/thioredoxin
MSLSRLLVLSMIIALFAGIGMAADDSTEVDLKTLADKIDAIDKRIQNLERTLAARLTKLERTVAAGGGGAPAGPSPAVEAEAQKAYASVTTAMRAGDYAKAKTEMATFMGKYSATNTAKQARRLNIELGVIGKSVPTNWGITQWFQGESDVDLASDKTTLLVFWEVWCPHCKREVPKLEEIHTKYVSDGLQVVGLTKINKSATPEKVDAFIKENSISYPIAKEDGSLSRHFSVSGVPAAAVVKAGKVVWRGHPAKLTDAMLQGWM